MGRANQPSGHDGRSASSSSAAIRELLRGSWLAVVGLAASSLIGGLCEALFLMVITRAAFAISGRKSGFDVWHDHRVSVGTGILVALVLVALRLTLAVVNGAQSATLGSAIIGDTRRRLAAAFLHASWTVQQRERTGHLQELLTTFTLQSSALVSGLATAVSSGFNLIALLGLALVIDPRGSLIVIVFVAVLGSALRPVRAAVMRRGKRSAEIGLDFATSLSEISQLGMEVHVFDVQEQTERRVVRMIDAAQHADRRLTFVRSLIPSVYGGLAYLGVVGALAAVNASRETSLVSIGAVMLVMLRSLSYGQTLQTSSAQMNAAMPYLRRLQEQLDTYHEGRQVDGGQSVDSVGDLAFDDVWFSYVPGQPVLKGMSFTIASREVVGIVGPSGGGKSTLVQLLLGLREPDAGSVLADGRPLPTLSRHEWARRVTFVPQAAHLITGTVADNIRFLRDDVSQADIELAAAQANLTADIAAFPEGYDRLVGDGGDDLSGGQQQRLCIARALVERPDVLILDEPTSALDVRSEQLIRETLRTLSERMTVVVIAHRLSTLDICDRIMVIQDGELKAFDTPAELEKASDFYREALVISGMR